MQTKELCGCGRGYWPSQAWQHKECVANTPVANADVANAVANKKRGKYKDPEARKKYMRELMRKRRAK